MGWTCDAFYYVCNDQDGHFPSTRNPGDVPTFPTFAAPAPIKNVERLFKRDKTYFTLYKNIYRACYKMVLNNNIANKFKMSPDPCLISWNATMSIQDILTQLELAYGRPTGHELLQNDALFRLPFHNTKAPKCLFWHIKQCQEIQFIADNPYTLMQLMTNAVQLLMASGIFSAREFEDWEATPNKMYGSLKVFIHGAYARRLIAIHMCTTGQHGYVANPNTNMFQVLEDSATITDDDTSVATTMNQTADNATTGSTLDNTYAASLALANPSPAPQDYVVVATVINQLSVNQTAMWSHMQNLLLRDHAPPTHVANPVVYNPPRNVAAFQAPYQAPPIHALTVPAPFQAGRRKGHGQGGCTRRCPGCGGHSPNLFGPVGRRAGTMYVPGGVVQPTYGPYPPTLTPATVQHNTPTLIKKYNNWNVLYLRL
jgi:hypothetical protein